MKRHLTLFALIPAVAFAASSDELPFELASNVPPHVWQQIDGSHLLDGYSLSTHLNPFYLNGDFDGDARLDTAVLIRSRVGNKAGIAVFHAASESPVILGAGKPIPGDRGDTFDWMNAWQVRPRGPVSSAHEPGSPPTLKGDAILVVKLEASSALLYWNGSAYGWYQQGD